MRPAAAMPANNNFFTISLLSPHSSWPSCYRNVSAYHIKAGSSTRQIINVRESVLSNAVILRMIPGFGN
ncbi:Uncharacterised protein [Mycobacteroides abscessus subsp. abscessus]|nr:Uncharacterised protein [Mycobacteroides abscessus subsp. abscessus]